jgi:hypothetical protein
MASIKQQAFTIILGTIATPPNFFSAVKKPNTSIRRLSRRHGIDVGFRFDKRKSVPWKRTCSKKRQKELERNDKREDDNIPSYTIQSNHQMNIFQPNEQPTRSLKITLNKLNGSEKKDDPPLPTNIIPGCSPNTLIDQLEIQMSTMRTPEKKIVCCRLQNLFPKPPSTPPPLNIAHKFVQKLEQADSPLKKEMFNVVEQSLPRKPPPPPISPMVQATNFAQQLEQYNTPLRDDMFNTVKKSFSSKQLSSPPLPMILAQKFAQRLEHVGTPLREEMFHTVKQSVRKKQKNPFESPNKANIFRRPD